MVKITEDYVSFEIAKLLKEKRFNGLCNAYYDCFTTDNFHSSCEPTDFNSIDTKIRDIVSAPTLQMTMKWLREVHDIKIMIRPYVDGTYSYEILNGFWYVNFDSYEDAAEAAIKYCLENLI